MARARGRQRRATLVVQLSRVQRQHRALRVSEALRFAIVGINDINPTSAAAPFGGMKESGLGRELGHEGLEAYLETKYVSFKLRD